VVGIQMAKIYSGKPFWFFILLKMVWMVFVLLKLINSA